MITVVKRANGDTPSPAARGATTRRRNRAFADGGAYGMLLRALSMAQKASDQAESRAASGADRGDLSLAERNYQTSSEARDRDRAAMEAHVHAADDLLVGISWLSGGWQQLPLEYARQDCWYCDGTGQRTECDHCDGAGAYMADEKCGGCHGSGLRLCQVCIGDGESSNKGRCAHCRGAGFGDCERCDGSGRRMIGEIECDDCHGSGEADPIVCPTCDGSGVRAWLARPRCWVFCIDLPSGQVSFRCGSRGSGPRYQGAWSDTAASLRAGRILTAIDELAALLTGKVGSPLAMMTLASVA
jgi:hypothetical protein